MGISKCTLCSYVKIDGIWGYCKAAYHGNGKIKLDIASISAKQALLEKHSVGRHT
jgi:hypothetical protein